MSLLATYFATSTPELSSFGPLTSKDFDYFGGVEAARKLNDALHGVLKLPTTSDHTPSAAIVEASIRGEWVQIDFLNYVLGTDPDKLKQNAIDILVLMDTPTGPAQLAVPVMHPIHCYQSRIANAVILKRQDPGALRQLHASHYVLRAYISELIDINLREAKKVFAALFKYFKSDPNGRQAFRVHPCDPGELFGFFAEDRRIDFLYRVYNLATMSRWCRAQPRSQS